MRREGGEVIVTFDVGAEAVPASPAAGAPMDEVHVEKVATLAVIHVKVAPEVPFEVAREPRRITLTFGEESRPREDRPARRPPRAGGGRRARPRLARGLPGPVPGGLGRGRRGARSRGRSDLAREGLQVGPVHLRPSILTSYVDGDYTLLDTPDPVPTATSRSSPGWPPTCRSSEASSTAEYGLRLRFFSQFDEINTTSHLLNAGLEVPLGSRTMLRLRDHFSTGVLEATEVDPGQEYFFDLSRFRRNEIEAGRGWRLGRAVFLDGVRRREQRGLRRPEGASFPTARATPALGAGLTFGDNLRAGLYYSYDRIPPPADAHPRGVRPSNSVGVAVEGDFGCAHHRRDTTRLPEHGLAPGGGGRAELSRSRRRPLPLARALAQLPPHLQGRRATDLSAFEDNAFYVSTGGRVLFSFGLPWSLSVNTGVGYQENQYRDGGARSWGCRARTRSSAGASASRGPWAASPTFAPTTAATAAAPTCRASTSRPTGSWCRWASASSALR